MATLVKKYGSDRIIVNSAADWGISDPLKVPKTITVMRQQGIDEDTIQRIVWSNPVAFFAQSGKLDVTGIDARPEIDRKQQYATNSVLRGERYGRPRGAAVPQPAAGLAIRRRKYPRALASSRRPIPILHDPISEHATRTALAGLAALSGELVSFAVPSPRR